jgi:hypothetical protein
VDAKIKGLTLSPLRSELELAPGTSQEGSLTVTNSTDSPMKVDLSTEIFSIVNQQYDYAFTAESDVTKWVSFKPSTLELAAGELAKVVFMINVPLQSEPGGRYLSMFASNETGTTGNGVSSRQRIASLLYITVTGDVSREGHLVSLTSPWLVTGANTWSVALQNTGTTHFRARHNVQIVNLFGNKASKATIMGESLILPGSVRLVTDNLPLPQWPGVYKMIYTIGLGDTPARVETRYILYVTPLSIVVFITTLTFIISWMRRKRASDKS